jgi:hypothetical protein
MFNEYDVVKLTEDMPEENLSSGATGTVLMVYTDSPPTYEVEFSDDSGVTLALITIRGNKLDLVSSNK